MRGLDLLESLPFVKPGGFGAIGHSLGGHNSVYTAVFDDRIKAVVSSCGLDSFLDYYGGDEKIWQPEKGWCQTRYMPRLAGYRGRLEDIPFDFHELIGALAPRHVLIIAPLKDRNFQADSVDRIAAAARPVFKLYGHPDRLRVEHPDCEHDFPQEMREAAYELFDAVLRLKPHRFEPGDSDSRHWGSAGRIRDTQSTAVTRRRPPHATGQEDDRPGRQGRRDGWLGHRHNRELDGMDPARASVA